MIHDDTPNNWDRIAGYILNALAGIGLLAFIIACAMAWGYWSNV